MTGQQPRVRIVSDGPAGWQTKIFVGDVQLMNVVRASFVLDAEELNRAVLEMVDVDIEAVAEVGDTEHRVALPDGPVRLTLTHREAELVLAARAAAAPDNSPEAVVERYRAAGGLARPDA